MLTSQHNFEVFPPNPASSKFQSVLGGSCISWRTSGCCFSFKITRDLVLVLVSVPQKNGTSGPVLAQFLQKKIQVLEIRPGSSSSYPANQWLNPGSRFPTKYFFSKMQLVIIPVLELGLDCKSGCRTRSNFILNFWVLVPKVRLSSSLIPPQMLQIWGGLLCLTFSLKI
jgi:hypothetical protein